MLVAGCREESTEYRSHRWTGKQNTLDKMKTKRHSVVYLTRMLNLNKRVTPTQRELFTLVNGRAESVLAKVKCCGQMAQDMKETGHSTKPRVKESSITQTVTFTKELGRGIRQMVKAFIQIKRVLATKELGLMTSSTVEDLKPGPKDHLTMESTLIVKRKEEENTSGLMGQATTEIGSTTKSMATEFINGKMVVNIMAPGRTTT